MKNFTALVHEAKFVFNKDTSEFTSRLKCDLKAGLNS